MPEIGTGGDRWRQIVYVATLLAVGAMVVWFARSPRSEHG